MSDNSAASPQPPDSGADAAQQRSTRRGIALMLGAVVQFGTMDALSKLLIADLPVLQIVWVRFVILALFAVGMSWRTGLIRALRTRRPWLQFGRGMLLPLTMIGFIQALEYMTLAEVLAIFAATPLLVTALSVPFLKENVGRRRWTAVVVGLGGVLLIVKPGVVEWQWALLLPMISATTFATYQILSKVCSREDGPGTALLYNGLAGVVLLTIPGAVDWRPPDLEQWTILVVVSIMGATAHLTLLKALEAAPASVLQPLSYGQMVVGTVWGGVLFGHIPTLTTTLGAALIAGSGIYVTIRERQVLAATRQGDEAKTVDKPRQGPSNNA